MLSSQPVAVAGGVGALVAPLVSWALPSAPIGVQGVLVFVLVALIVNIAKRYSFPLDTILNAGLNPQQVVADARNEDVLRFDPDCPECSSSDDDDSQADRPAVRITPP